jgi:hypothetical protein
MKKEMLFMTMMVSSLFGYQAIAQEVVSGPAISIDKETHDYGNIAFEANGECEFTITNTGTEPLIITGARGSCGCTVPTYPQEPIAPGKTAVIKVTYDTKRPGNFNKSVTITSNAVNEPTKTVYIKGNVAPKPEGSAPVAPATGPSVGAGTPAAPAAPANSRPANGSATLTTPKQ